MTSLDWIVVAVLNGGIVLYSLVAFRHKGESFDWYLAAKSMPWWVIGLSAFGTAVDSGDYVGIVGGSYTLGLSQLSQWWLGIAVGWMVLGFFVIVPMYRSGVFTNAEWLEFRFGPSARVLAVLINVQSRTNVLGNIYYSMFLVLNVVAGLPRGPAGSSSPRWPPPRPLPGPGRPARRGPHRRPAEPDHDRRLLRPVGVRLLRHGRLGRRRHAAGDG